MGRRAKPWFRKQNRTWYVSHRGKQVNLGQDKDAAEKQFHRLMATDEPISSPEFTCVELLDKFLVWGKSNRAEETYIFYRKHLQGFIDSLPNQRIQASKVRPHHVNDWIATKDNWSATYTRGGMGAIQRAFNWAVKQGYIDKSPIVALERPAAERREDYPTESEYKAMLEHSDVCFSDVLTFCWETGCRPQEMRAIEGRHVVSGRIQFPIKESKGKKRPRVIFLNRKAADIIKRRMTDGHLFVNRLGNPWTAYAINCRMRRLGKKTKKHFPLYCLRHAFATRMLEAGVDHITVAKWLGHVDASVLGKIYAHIGEKTDYLQQQLDRMSA